MVTEVTMWTASDGSIYATEEEAFTYEESDKIIKMVRDFLSENGLVLETAYSYSPHQVAIELCNKFKMEPK